MTFTEDLRNYAKRSLAHQLTRRIATQPCCQGIVYEIHYERTDRPNNQGTRPAIDAGIITFDTGMTIRIFDAYDPTYGYGLRVVDLDANGEPYNYGHRNYYRHTRRDLTDEQWRETVVARIASDYGHLYALRDRNTLERN